MIGTGLYCARCGPAREVLEFDVSAVAAEDGPLECTRTFALCPAHAAELLTILDAYLDGDYGDLFGEMTDDLVYDDEDL